MATIELDEQEYLNFLEFQLNKVQSRYDDIPNLIKEIKEEQKMRIEVLNNEKSELKTEIKEYKTKIKEQTKIVNKKDKTAENQEDIQSDYEN